MSDWFLEPQYTYILAEPFMLRFAANELASSTELGAAFLPNCKTESVEFTVLKFENADSIVFPAISDVGSFKSATARTIPLLLKTESDLSMFGSVQLVHISYDTQVNMQLIWEAQIEDTVITTRFIATRFIANLTHAAFITGSRNGNRNERHGEINISVVSFKDRTMKTWKLLAYKQAMDSMVNLIEAATKLRFIGEKIVLQLEHCAQCGEQNEEPCGPKCYELFTVGSLTQKFCTGCTQIGMNVAPTHTDLFTIQMDAIKPYLTLCYKNISDEHSIGPFFYIYTQSSLNDMGSANRLSDSVMLDAISNEAVEYIPKAASRVSEVIVRDGLMFLRMYLDQSELAQNVINDCLMNEEK